MNNENMILIPVVILFILIWLLKHLVVFYMGVLREKESKSRLLPILKIALPIAIVGVGTNIIIDIVLLVRTLFFT